ncbi:VanW family protein [Adlercreutzia sp. R7]|uniref:VanW family protein n=1 Tax=Adlercreutzia wanghongyangiae TaxID=3111451 RepID=A0ABU6IHK8_9ACTN|nr:VanW family protein [Adlercreutzia sp. R7]
MKPVAPGRPRSPKLPLVAAAAALVVAVIAGGVGFDQLMNGNRIYQGVSVGSVDVSGMTREEAANALDAAYSDAVASGLGIVFASDEAAQTVDVDTEMTEDAAQAEQLSVEEARADKKLWVAEAGVLGAHVPTADLAEEAFAVGRDAGGLAQRIEAATSTVSIPMRLDFDEDALEALAAEIDETIGEPRVDSNVQIEDGVATVVEGHDGTIVDRDEFRSKIAEGFLGATPDDFSFVAHTAFAPSRIDSAAAETCRAFIQGVLDRGLTFTFEGDQWDLDGATIGSWVTTTVAESEGGARLVPVLDEKTACADLLALIREAGFVSATTVNFRIEGGEVWVYAQDGSRYPLTADAVSAADAGVFGAFRDNGSTAFADERPTVAIGWGAAPSKSSFDDALAMGLIGEISSYTTEYNDGAGTANRRHNIHLAADLLTDSITPANGGIWSFTETMGGQANEEMGFKGAHVISGGEYTDAIGGGICQVATTVFNAVYEGGYPVTERRNHSLYISSYPTGRDAAIAYPYLDLKWENDTTSDVLLRTRYTDSTLTVTLYGIDPGYVVSTETGDWQKGDAYKTKYQVDEEESEGTRYVKTRGADGRSVTVHRTVRDRSGNLLHEEDFESNYKPINEVIVVGPNTPTGEEEDSEEKDDDKEDARVSTGD